MEWPREVAADRGSGRLTMDQVREEEGVVVVVYRVAGERKVRGRYAEGMMKGIQKIFQKCCRK